MDWRPVPECRALVIGGGSVGLLGGLILKAWGACEVPQGALDWIEERPLAEGGQAFHDLNAGHSRAAKIVLRP